MIKMKFSLSQNFEKTVIRILVFFFLVIATCTIPQQGLAQRQSDKGSNIRFMGDTRRTFVSGNSAVIYGVRLGKLINEKTEIGVGIYSSNLFGLLGSSVNKNYTDNSLNPSQSFAADIGFHYFSAFGEYTLIENQRLKLTANSQVGIGV